MSVLQSKVVAHVNGRSFNHPINITQTSWTLICFQSPSCVDQFYWQHTVIIYSFCALSWKQLYSNAVLYHISTHTNAGPWPPFLHMVNLLKELHPITNSSAFPKPSLVWYFWLTWKLILWLHDLSRDFIKFPHNFAAKNAPLHMIGVSNALLWFYYTLFTC